MIPRIREAVRDYAFQEIGDSSQVSISGGPPSNCQGWDGSARDRVY